MLIKQQKGTEIALPVYPFFLIEDKEHSAIRIK